VRFYYIEMIGTAVFAATGVLAVNRRGLDVIGAVVLGIVTAIGGGTVRDLIIGVPPFWIGDFNYVWAALAGALAAFWIGSAIQNVSRGLLYLDAIGAALFAVSAANKVLMLSLSGPVAVTMGVLTGIGGGLIRDALAGRETLLMSRDIYATPILLGCIVFVTIRTWAPLFSYPGLIAFLIIFGIRAVAIYRHLQMPIWLTTRTDDYA
jgi:uncharacterized membrane protein YeiH